MKTGRLSPAAVAEFLEPLDALADDPDLRAGSSTGRLILRSPEVARQFTLGSTMAAPPVVAGCFQIRPFLTELYLPEEFYVLTLSKKRVTLDRCAALHLESVPLPGGVPELLEDFTALEQPDHDLENRSSVGNNTGDMRAVRFGTGGEPENVSIHLADYFKSLDRALRGFLALRQAPLVLVGVGEDIALYHSVNTYDNLVTHGIQGSPQSFSTPLDLARAAHARVVECYAERAAAKLSQSSERVDPRRASTDLPVIVRSALEGRVHELFINQDAQYNDVCDGEVYRSWGKEDLLNVAAVKTIVHRGTAYALPAGKMPHGVVALAILRF